VGVVAVLPEPLLKLFDAGVLFLDEVGQGDDLLCKTTDLRQKNDEGDENCERVLVPLFRKRREGFVILLADRGVFENIRRHMRTPAPLG